MNPIGKLTDLGIVSSLLPGLVAYLVVRQCTARERKIDVTEAILHALAYTLLSHAIWAICTSLGSLIPTPEIVGLTLCAVFVGLVVSVTTNHRISYSLLRKLRLTRQAEFPTIWETSFVHAERELSEYAVFELDDDRRIMGAIRGVSSDCADGHICLEKCQWLSSELHNPSVPIEGWFLVQAKRVKSVHFIPRGETEDVRTPRTNSAPTTAPE